MELAVSNVAAVSKARIAIDGITVICGKNDTGKSTLSRALWCLFDGMHRYDEQVQYERRRSIERALVAPLDLSFVRYSGTIDTTPLVDAINSDLSKAATDKPYVSKAIRTFYGSIDGFDNPDAVDNIDDVVMTVMELARVSDDNILRRLLGSRFESEYHHQINNVDSDGSGSIELNIRGERYAVRLSRNSVESYTAPHALRTRAMYVDDPFVLECLGLPLIRWNIEGHQLALLEALAERADGGSGDVLHSIVTDDRLQRALDRLGDAVKGSMVLGGRGRYVYQPAGGKKALDIHNISAGMKAFVILKHLLQNGTIEQHGTVILDEPEVHLHPEWQLAYAEIVVLLQREFDLHVLLNTHSPYFLHAIEVYAARHGIANRCRYYMMQRDAEGCSARDVTHCIDVIYKEMADPFATLDDASPEK